MTDKEKKADKKDPTNINITIQTKKESPKNQENKGSQIGKKRERPKDEQEDEKDWWGDFCIISRKLIEESGVDPAEIKALGTSALGADCLPVDEQCNPLRMAILYGIDARAVDEIKQLTEMYGEQQIRKWYGRLLCSSDIMPKILWIKNKEPEIYEKTYKFITASFFYINLDKKIKNDIISTLELVHCTQVQPCWRGDSPPFYSKLP